MTMLELLQDKGFGPFRKSGSRYVGICPVCGGSNKTNKFVTKIGSATGHCFSCDWKGGTVKMLRQLDGIGCKEAHAQLELDCDGSATCPVYENCQKSGSAKRKDHAASLTVPAPRAKDAFIPAAPRTPAEIWQGAADKLVQESHERLLQNPEALAYLASRGLPIAAVDKYRLGWLEGEKGKPCIFRPRSTWGLAVQPGESKSLWIPRGIVIPTVVDDRIDRIRIRRPGEDLRDDNDPKYIAIQGGGNALVSLNPEARAQMPIESDLDALLVDFVAGDLVGAVPLTTCTVRPDSGIAATLEQAVIILVALDADPLVSDLKTRKVKSAGPTNTLWWQKHYPKSERWPVPEGKDPGEAYQKGVDLRAWVMDGLPISLHPKKAATLAKQEAPSVDFDSNKVQLLISDTYSRVNSLCPKGAAEWLEEHRPDVVVHLLQAGKAVDAAYAAEDVTAVKEALKTWERYHLAAWKRYETRPPVIERQDELFEATQPADER